MRVQRITTDLHVEHLDAAHAEAQERGARRLHGRAPDATVVNVVQHHR